MTGIPITRPSKKVFLPEDVAATLAANRRNPAVLYPLLLSLSEAGWSLASLSVPFGVSRETIRIWLNTARTITEERVPVPAPPAVRNAEQQQEAREAKVKKESAKSARIDALVAEYLPRILELQDDARSLRGPSSSSPAYAQASAEYTRLLNEVIGKGVTATRMARELGVQPVTIYARLRRGGYRTKAPSERIPQWADIPPTQALATVNLLPKKRSVAV